MKKLLLLLSLFFSTQVIAFDPIEDGFARAAKALQKNDLKQAAKIWLPLAERGHAGSRIHIIYVLSQDVSVAVSDPKIMNLLMEMAQYNDAEPIQYNQSEQILLWKVYREHQLLDKANDWLKKIGKTEEEAEAIFQQDKADAKKVLDDVFGLSVSASANTQDYQPQNKVEFQTLAAQAHAYDQPITLFDCKTNKKQHLELLWSNVTFDFFRQGKIEYESEREKAYLHEYANGTQLIVPHNGKWYLFEEAQSTTGFTHVELIVRNAKTGQVLEYQECENDVTSLIPLLSTDDVKPLPDELAEWLFEVSNKYVP